MLDSYLGDEFNQSDWFHIDERFNQGNENEVHQEDEFNDCDVIMLKMLANVVDSIHLCTKFQQYLELY